MILSENKLAFWTCSAVTSINAAISFGFSVAALLAPGAGGLYAMYAASRSVACLLVVLASVLLRSRAAIATMALTMGLVQTVDGVIGILSHDVSKTVGPFVLAAATFASAMALFQSSAQRPSV